MNKSTHRKSFEKFVQELQSIPALTERKQESSRDQESHRHRIAERGTTEQDDDVEQRQSAVVSHIQSRRKELAAAYPALDRTAAMPERTAGRNDSPAHNPDLDESFCTDAAPPAFAELIEELEDQPVLTEGDQLSSQARSAVLQIIGHVQGLHRTVLGDHVATRANKQISAEIACLTSIVSILIGVHFGDQSIVARASSFRG